MKNGGENLISLQRRNNFVVVGFVRRLSATKFETLTATKQSHR